MSRLLLSIFGALSLGAAVAGSALAAAPAVAPLCRALSDHVDGAGGKERQAPVFLRSYEPGPDENSLPPALATSAFSYDNALAIMALISCGDVDRARRIGDAFVTAASADRTFKDGRIRNAYRAGPVTKAPAALPGWWDKKRSLWAEDAYQDGTQTGNVAWVALALLWLDKATSAAGEHGSQYRASAMGLARWIAANTSESTAPGGFSGGYAGFDPKQTKLTWRSTEHNVDVQALGAWLTTWKAPQAPQLAGNAKRFLAAMYDERDGMFRLGTTPDGATQPADHFALDELIWPLIGVKDAPADWRRSLDFADAHVAVDGGFDFNGDRDGIWTEGTAQASLVMRAAGRKDRARELLATALKQGSPSGYLFATAHGTISTGLRIGPQSTTDDFFYFHRPHLGATAWAILAATGLNPFTGSKVD